MRTSTLTVLLGFLLIFASTCELASIESSDKARLYKCHSNEMIISSDAPGGTVTNQPEIFNEPSRNEVMSAVINFDKAKIDYFTKVMHYDLISTGVWDDLIKMDCLPGVKYLLQCHFVGADVRKESFRYAIGNGAEGITGFMLEEYKDIIEPESEMEKIMLVKLAFERMHYNIVTMLLKEGFTSKTILPLNRGRSLLHDAGIHDGLTLVKVLLFCKYCSVNTMYSRYKDQIMEGFSSMFASRFKLSADDSSRSSSSSDSKDEVDDDKRVTSPTKISA